MKKMNALIKEMWLHTIKIDIHWKAWHQSSVCAGQVTDREMQDFSQSQLMDQGSIHNSGIDIPKRKDKEDLTESSEVVPFSFS